MKTSRGFDIRRQVLAAFALIAVVLLSTAAIAIWSLHVVRAEYTSYIEQILAQEKRLLTYQNQVSLLQSNAREFLNTRRSELQRGAEAIRSSMKASLETYLEEADHLAEGTDHEGEEHHQNLEALASANESYWESYQAIIDLWREKGLNEESGLRGALREAAHELESEIEANRSDPLMVDYLTIRRHEKDYLLRGDQTYIERNRESVQEIRNAVAALGLPASTEEEMRRALDVYQEALERVVEVDRNLDSATAALSRQASALTSAIRGEIADGEEQLSEALERTESRIQNATGLTLAMALIGLLVAGVTAFVTTRRISRPLLLLLASTEGFAEGDLTSEVAYAGRDEFGQIASSLNNAIARIRELIRDAHSSADAIRDVTSSLAESTTESASAITQITANVRSISDQNENLAEKTARSAEASERISGETWELRELVDGQSAMVTETTSSVEQMIANIRNVTSIAEGKQEAAKGLVGMADKGGSEVQNTNQIASEIAELASGIEDVIKVINGISAQTNLLAMNAAIEAAHAGEAGRGFAVVAAEIRTLAESSGSNAKRIAEMLKHLTERIRAVDDSSYSSTQLFENIRQEIVTYSDSLEEITAAMREMSIGSNEVLKAAEEMSASSNQISDRSGHIKDEIELISGGTKEVDELASQVSTGLTEIKGALTEIDGSVTMLSSLSENNRETFLTLEEALDRFKVDASGEGASGMPQGGASPGRLEEESDRPRLQEGPGARPLERRASAGWTLDAPEMELAEEEPDILEAEPEEEGIGTAEAASDDAKEGETGKSDRKSDTGKSETGITLDDLEPEE